VFGGDGGMVEVDETFIGREEGKEVKPSYHHKMKVLSLVDRQTGRARSFVIDGVSADQIEPIVVENIAREARLMTDDHGVYRYVAVHFADHKIVAHRASEYVRGEFHTNTIEGYISIFKRGMKGVYQHCQKKHLHRYLAEFDFRYSNRVALGYNDADRADVLLKGVIGKRLTYQTTGAA
jgi:hypothetical protein